jgi:hypothetical protein
LERIFPSRHTAAAVSSQEDSIPKMTGPALEMSAGFLFSITRNYVFLGAMNSQRGD